jgi:hypothetical protein
MAGSPLFLYRKDRRWQKVSNVIELTMTSNQTAYASVTGVAGTGIITVTGATLVNGQILTLNSKTGGSGVSLGVGYYIIDASGATGKLSLIPGGSAVALGTDISAGSGIVSQPELCVWSSEFRDIFNNTNTIYADPGATLPLTNSSFNVDVALIPGALAYAELTDPTVPSIGETTGGLGAASVTSSVSDEISHYPLRQTFLKKSFWKFDRGASVEPRYLYAEYMLGDQILDNPPETV